MSSLIIKIYEWFHLHRIARLLSLIFLSVLLLLLLLGQRYKEDISDFLPLDNKYQKALGVYQNISGADRILAIFQCKDTSIVAPDQLTAAIEDYLERLDGRVDDDFRKKIITGVDMEKFSNVADFVYEHIPFFLTHDDYLRMDSLLADSNYVANQIGNVKQMLMFPASGLLSEHFKKDPLNIFTPVVSKLQPSSTAANYELYDGYVFSPDLKTAMVVMTSPYGASETEENAKLLSVLEEVGNDTEQQCDGVRISLIGGPAIAVGNSRQIKNDSTVSVILAIVLIVCLLFAVFRNFKNILLIVLSIGWGWLFAMGTLALVHDNVSMIVIGISSVILGIAVNYPLHLIAHLGHTPNVKSALKEIVMPLVVGNITTVGAFMALVPLKSVALRDLGLFSSFLLVGTILFVLLFLPHMVSAKSQINAKNIFFRFSDFSLENNSWVVWCVIGLTIVFGYFSLQTSFDANMNHINYMTERQLADFSTLQKMMWQVQSNSKIYVVSSDSTLEGALESSERLMPEIQEMENEDIVLSTSECHRFLISSQEQQQRLQNWQEFIKRHSGQIEQKVLLTSKAEGFNDDTFLEFYHILNQSYAVLPTDSFAELYHSVLASNFVADTCQQQYHIIEVLDVDRDKLANIEERLDNIDKNGYAFDVGTMNSSIATSISEDFNYIGWACGLIVFFFLWLSLGSIELAMLSFLPMAISWIWILGIMTILGIQFNVVNIILATFIFGQGDDYTIFMTEGCQYEYAYRKKMLSSYKNSIFVSALIMFIGIGTLITSRHPALHSLAEVTIVGMFSVVLMACIFPPLIFKWMVLDGMEYRRRPFSVTPFLVTCYSAIVFFTQLATVYILGFILFVVFRPSRKSKAFFHRYVKRCFWFDMNRIATTKFTIHNPQNETFSRPAIVVCNHQSMLDTAYLMAMTDKIAIVANENASQNLVIKQIFKWLDYYSIVNGETIDESKIGQLLSNGYCVVIFPEGERNPNSSILRFHKGAFYLAECFQVDIIPLLIHGINHVFPRNTFCTYPGEVTISVGDRIRANDHSWGKSYVERTKKVHQHYLTEYEKLRKKQETASYFKDFVTDRYRYKGIEIFVSVKKRLRKYEAYSKWINMVSEINCSSAVVINGGYGEFALMLSMCHPSLKTYAFERDEDKCLVAMHSAEDVAKNLAFSSVIPADFMQEARYGISPLIYLVEPTTEDEAMYQKYNPIIIK